MQCRVTFTQGAFVCKTSFDSRHIPKSAGFFWDAVYKTWYTPSSLVASRLREYADDSAKAKINECILNVTPWTRTLPRPPEGLEYLPHQPEDALFALSRNRSYLGLDPGLGKTIVATIIARAFGQRVVYICPTFLTRNTLAEFERWAPELKVEMYSKEVRQARPGTDVLIIPDSILIRQDTQDDIAQFAEGGKALLIVDEAHRYKNDKAQRTVALFGGKNVRSIVDVFAKVVLMSGTPLQNRPIELYPVLSKMAPETIDFKDKFDYARRYCAAFHTGFGWDMSGHSNMEELARRVIAPTGPFMVRRKKSLLNLPPKTEELFVFSRNMSPRLAKMNADIGQAYRDVEDVMKAAIAKAAGKSEDDLSVASYRRLLGIEKVGATVEYVKSILDEGEESVLLFAYHKDVIAELEQELAEYRPFVISGATSNEDRQAYVNQFQKSKDRNLFIANYLAAGVGYTLTKAARVIHHEWSWVPGENDQASDRAHRIGQTKPVLVQYMVYADTIDKAVIETLLRKKRSIQYV